MLLGCRRCLGPTCAGMGTLRTIISCCWGIPQLWGSCQHPSIHHKAKPGLNQELEESWAGALCVRHRIPGAGVCPWCGSAARDGIQVLAVLELWVPLVFQCQRGLCGCCCSRSSPSSPSFGCAVLPLEGARADGWLITSSFLISWAPLIALQWPWEVLPVRTAVPFIGPLHIQLLSCPGFVVLPGPCQAITLKGAL